jgi:hypothetical protein
MHADKLTLELRLSILKQHSYDLLEVPAKLVQGLRLRMCSGKPRHATYEQVRLGIFPDDR